MDNDRSGRAFRLAVLMISLPCFAASPIWDGTWKLNAARSSYPGPTFVITITPRGEYHFSNALFDYAFGCDGGEYPSHDGRTVSCTHNGPSEINVTTKEKGEAVTISRWELSKDGRSLTIASTSSRPDGSLHPHVRVFSRTTATTGFAGGWSDTNRLKEQPSFVLKLSGGTLHIRFEDGQYCDVKLDGSDAPIKGPNLPTGLTLAVQPNGARELLTVRKFKGRITGRGSMTISAGGRTLTEQFWNSRKPDQKAVFVYEKAPRH